MRDMADKAAGDDLRLLSIAYIEYLLTDNRQATHLLEREPRILVRSVGSLAWFLMDAVVIPAENGICWDDGWVSVDFRARTDPHFKANLLRRGRYRRLASGYALRRKHRLRRAAQDCVDMLCVAHISKYGRTRQVTREEAALEMVRHFRERFFHSGDGH